MPVQTQGVTARGMFVAAGVVFEVMAAVFFVTTLAGYVRDRQTAAFVPVRAEISDTQTRRVSQGKNAGVRYEWAVGYQYLVDGRAYHGTRLRRTQVWDFGGDTEEEARERAASTYPVGRAVDAFYDPEDPADAVLEREPPSPGGLFCPATLAVLGLPGSLSGLLPVWRRWSHGSASPPAGPATRPDGPPTPNPVIGGAHEGRGDEPVQ